MKSFFQRTADATRVAGGLARRLSLHASCTALALVMLPMWANLAESAEPPPPTNEPPAVIDAAKFPTLQAAFDAVPEAGGLVRLPPGNFELAEPLVLSRENTRVEGAGAATHLINRNEDGQPALVLRPPQDDGKPAKKKIWRVQLADFRISGNPKSGDGLRAEHVNEIYLHGLSVDHNGGHGINLVHCLEDPRVADCIITYNAQAGLYILGGHDIVVNANQFEENQDAVCCIDSYNLCMNGNNLDDHLRHGVVIENTYGSVLSGNMIEECQGIAIVMDRDCYGNTISANVIAHDFSGGVDLRDAWGCTVSANTFTMCKPFGVRVGPEAGRIIIAGNSFSNAHIGGENKRDDKSHGVVLEKTEDVCVSGNTLTGMQKQAVTADAGCCRIAVTGNLVSDCNQAGGEPLPPIDLGGAKDSLVERNLIGPGLPAPEQK